jgi:hypothetical protein
MPKKEQRPVQVLRKVAFFALCVLSMQCSKGETDTSHRRRDGGRVFLPQTIGALSLDDPGAFQPDFREAVEAARAELLRKGKNPALSFAQISVVPPDEIIIHVWPASMFGAERPAGGGGRSLTFSRRSHKIVKGVAWQ